MNHHRFPLREVLAGVALAATVVLAALVFVERLNRQNTQHRQLCAVERYVERRFEIDKAISSTPSAVFAERLAAIRQMEREVGIAGCNIRKATPQG